MQADWMGSFWKQKKTLKTSKQILQINTVYIIVRENFKKNFLLIVVNWKLTTGRLLIEKDREVHEHVSALL